MSGNGKSSAGRRRGAMHVFNVGPCFTCGYRSVCWFAGLGWDKVNHMGGSLSDFQEPPCSRLKAVPTMMPPDRVVPQRMQRTRRVKKANRQSHSTPAGQTHRREGSADSD